MVAEEQQFAEFFVNEFVTFEFRNYANGLKGGQEGTRSTKTKNAVHFYTWLKLVRAQDHERNNSHQQFGELKHAK